MANSVDVMIISFFVLSWMIIHFGVNLESGKRTSRDSIYVKLSEVIRSILFHVCEREYVVLAELYMNNIKVASIIMT